MTKGNKDRCNHENTIDCKLLRSPISRLMSWVSLRWHPITNFQNIYLSYTYILSDSPVLSCCFVRWQHDSIKHPRRCTLTAGSLLQAKCRQLEVNWNHHGITESPRRLRFSAVDLKAETFTNEVFSPKSKKLPSVFVFFRPRVGKRRIAIALVARIRQIKWTAQVTQHQDLEPWCIISFQVTVTASSVQLPKRPRLARFPWVPTRCFEPSVFSNGSNFLSQQNAPLAHLVDLFSHIWGIDGDWGRKTLRKTGKHFGARWVFLTTPLLCNISISCAKSNKA